MDASPFKSTTQQFPKIATAAAATVDIPTIDLFNPDAKHLIVRACEEFGFFKAINHSIPMNSITKLYSEASNFFAKPSTEKIRAFSPTVPVRYGSKHIGSSGDIGWIEYLLIHQKPNHPANEVETMLSAIDEYVKGARKTMCDLLELIADALGLESKDVFSQIVTREASDTVLRINHYPPVPDLGAIDKKVVGFGEHTDPQLISLLISNGNHDFQIQTRDGDWVSVPPNEKALFVNVGDTLQVMTNGRFRSVRHRVLVGDTSKARLSMVYFGGPPMKEKIGPLPSLMAAGQPKLYKDYTWFEYVSSSIKTRLAQDKLMRFRINEVPTT